MSSRGLSKWMAFYRCEQEEEERRQKQQGSGRKGRGGSDREDLLRGLI